MLIAIHGIDHPDSGARRQAERPAHLARIQPLADAGRIVIAGPLRDTPDGPPVGSLIIGEFESIEAARAWIEADPYWTGGVFARIDVRHYTRVLP